MNHLNTQELFNDVIYHLRLQVDSVKETELSYINYFRK